MNWGMKWLTTELGNKSINSTCGRFSIVKAGRERWQLYDNDSDVAHFHYLNDAKKEAGRLKKGKEEPSIPDSCLNKNIITKESKP